MFTMPIIEVAIMTIRMLIDDYDVDDCDCDNDD